MKTILANWRALLTLGFCVFALGILSYRGPSPGGVPWALIIARIGALMALVGAALGLTRLAVRLITGRFPDDAAQARRWKSDEESSAIGDAHNKMPRYNVNGNIMVNDSMDITGRPYGDCGPP